MAVDKTQKDSDIDSKPQEMSSPMFPEITESTTGGRRGGRKARKIWKRPIRISRLPSFGYSGSDFTFDQIPAIFSGYTAGSEDSSSSEMSDASRSYSQSVSSDENEEISHVRSRAVWKRPSLKRMKSISRIPIMKLQRQLTRKLSGGVQIRQKLKKVRSVKLSSSRNLGFRDDRSSSVLSGEAVGLSQPHYLKPTSSSASKKVGKIQKNLKPNLGATAKKFSGGLTRTRSLRYSGLLRATCSSALKDSKIGNDVSDGKVCRYTYCSLHGHHSHADNVNVPSLKRFMSMRRRLLKRQKSTNRRLVLLKRSLSRKRGSAIGKDSADQESGQVNVTADGKSSQAICEEHNSSSEIYGYGVGVESISISPETRVLSLVDVGENQDGRSSLEIGTEPTTLVVSAGKGWGNLSAGGEESKPPVMDESNGRTGREMQKNVKLWRLIYQQMVTGLGHESGNLGAVKSEETAEDSKTFGGEISWSFQDGSVAMEDEENSPEVQAIEHDKSTAVKLVKQALDEILSEIPDYSSDDKSITGDKTSEHEHVKGEDDRELDVSISSSNSKTPIMAQDADVSEITFSSDTIEETNRRGREKWSYLKKVILLKRFVKSLENITKFDQRELGNLPVESDQGEAETKRSRHRLIGERKNAEEWMLDYALRQVISTLAPSERRKVELLVQAFETVIPRDGFRAHDLGSPSRAEAAHVDSDPGCTTSHLEIPSEAVKEAMPLDSNLREKKDESPDLQEVTESPLQGASQSENTVSGEGHMGQKLAREMSAASGCLKCDEATESLAGASLCEEELDGSGSSKEDEKKEHHETRTKAEKQNLIKWRNLIYKHVVSGLTVDDESKHRVCKREHVEDVEKSGSADGSRSFRCSSGINQIAGVEEDGDAANSPSRAVKLVQQALEKVLSEIPDRPYDDETVSASSNSNNQAKQDSQGRHTTKSWNNLKKVILVKQFVKSLEKVRKFNPRKVWYIPVESDFEAEKVILRHRLTEQRNDSEHLMLDYALRQAISRLAPVQRRKVALLVHAFDAVLGGSGKGVQLQDDQTCQDSAASVSDHESPKESMTDATFLDIGGMGKDGFSSLLLEGSGSSMTDQKPNLKKDSDVNADEQSITADFRGQENQRYLKEEDGGLVRRESKLLLTSTRDVKQKITVEGEKDTELWNLIYKHMVTGLQTPKDSVDQAYGLKTLDHHHGYYEGELLASVEDEYHDEGGLKVDTRSSGAVTLVREALEKMLSEIPDQSSDDQSVDGDITTDQETFERNSEFGEELVSSASMAVVTTQVDSDDKAGKITFKQRLGMESRHKSKEKTVKGWSNVKKVILLRRFVKELGTIMKLNPRMPRNLPLESDPEAEKINLRHQPLEGRKSSEEWMLDYALRQVISTLAPLQKRKVALLAQAFDSISLQDTSSCSSPSIATSLHMSRQSSTSSLIQSETDTGSEIGEARRLVKARDSDGSLEASVQNANPINDRAKCRSGYRMQEVPNSILHDMNEEGTPVVHPNETDSPSYWLEDDGEIAIEKLKHPQEEGKEAEEAAGASNAAPGSNLEKQQCTSLWRLLCKHMESVADNEKDQTFFEDTSKEKENNDEASLDNHSADGENMELYQSEAVKLLEEVIDGISLPDSEGDDLRDDQMGNAVSDKKHPEATNTEKDGSNHQDYKARQKTETEQMPQVQKRWSKLKRVILLKRFVKALEKMRKFNPREPRFLPLNPDPEAEKINLRHQETQNKKNGEEWMVDYALQDVVAKLTPARKRKVQVLVQAFETVSATGT